jgi:hypothetical protein
MLLEPSILVSIWALLTVAMIGAVAWTEQQSD